MDTQELRGHNAMATGNQPAEQSVQDGEYLDYAGLCDFLKIARGTARNWKSENRIPHTKINGKVLFPKRDIIRLLRRGTIRTTQESFEAWQDNRNGTAVSEPSLKEEITRKK